MSGINIVLLFREALEYDVIHEGEQICNSD